MNFARLNHILIPTSKDGRDRFRKTRFGRFMVRVFGWAMTLTDEGIGAFLLWLFLLAFAVNVGTTQFYILWSGLTGLLVASVLVSRWCRIPSATLHIRAQKRISVGEPMTFHITLWNNGVEPLTGIRLHLPFLPWDGVWRLRPHGFSSGAEAESDTIEARAVFNARGLHQLDLFAASASVPLGLTHGPQIFGECPKFHVVPRIARIGSFSLPSIHRYQPGGIALASVSGESRELIGIRPYRTGDPIRDIHAASWARTGAPKVREYRQEYFTRIGIAVDTDKTEGSEAAFEAALSVTAGILAHLSRGEALIDLMVFGDEIHPFTLGRHLGFLDQALDLLAEASLRPSWSLDTLMSRIEPYLARLSAMVFITLADDEKRRSVAELIASRGTAVRTILVTDKKKPSPGIAHPKMTILRTDVVSKDEEIFL